MTVATAVGASYDRAPRPYVVIADDEANLVDLLALVLEDEGYRVGRAYDGLQAWDLAQRRRPDLVITDVMMPGLSGMELVERLRRGEGDSGPPVIVMSAVSSDQPAPPARFIPKPFDLDRLIDLVDHLVATADADRPADAG